MRRAALIIAVLVAGLGCVKDRPCRDNTVMVNVTFADSRDLVDGVALKYRLEYGPAVDLKPIERPSGVDQDGLELVVQDYASHKKLTLEYAPSKAGNVVGPWQEEVVELKPGCTTVDLIVAIGGGDAGPVDALVPTVDASLAIDVSADATVDVRPAIDAHADRSVDAPADAVSVAASVDALFSEGDAPDVPFVVPEVGATDAAGEADVSAASGRDAPTERATSVDLPVVAGIVDATLVQDSPSDAAPDARPDAALEVSTWPGPDVGLDGPASPLCNAGSCGTGGTGGSGAGGGGAGGSGTGGSGTGGSGNAGSSNGGSGGGGASGTGGSVQTCGFGSSRFGFCKFGP